MCSTRDARWDPLPPVRPDTRGDPAHSHRRYRSGVLSYYILEGGFWAVSNSFALLVARASAKRSLSVYPPAAIAFHLKGGVHMGEQLASFNTLVEEVRMLPATSEICVDLGTNHAKILDTPIMDIFKGNGRSYEEIVFDFISQARGVLAALLPMAPSVQCQLSGGYDSRLVLALLMGQDLYVPNPRTRFSRPVACSQRTRPEGGDIDLRALRHSSQ